MPQLQLTVYGTERLAQSIRLSSSVRIEPGRSAGAPPVVVRELRPSHKPDLRCWLDQVLLTLRLWKQGRVSCRNAVRDTPPACEDPQWYIPWPTWVGSTLEDPLTWNGAERALPPLWQAISRLTAVEDHRLRRFFQFYFYPVAVDRFSMLFMAADGLLFPYPAAARSSKDEFGLRGARLLHAVCTDRSEDELKGELTGYYEKRNGEFHGTARISGADIQPYCERLEQYVRLLITHFLSRDLLGSAKAAEQHILRAATPTAHRAAPVAPERL
jgi:hypothetical protein